MTLEELENSMHKCDLCKDVLLKYYIEPRPVFSGKEGTPILLIGQAPGITEYNCSLPFQGEAGQSIKTLFHSCGLKNFDENVYQTSITKCFPGRKPSLSVDRKPSQIEVNNCLPFLIKQIELVKPALIVCLGMLAWKTLISLKEQDEKDFCKENYNKSVSSLTTGDIVGKMFKYRGISILPMIHPSGAANGSRAKNKYEHELSIQLLKNLIKLVNKKDFEKE